MPNVALLSDAESRHLATGTLFVVRPVVPQPPEGTHSLVWNANEGEDLPHLWLADNDYGEYPGDVDFDQYVRCPFGAPGDTLLCKEAWAYTTDSDADIIWERDLLYRATDPDYYPRRWRPASTMPARFVRHRPVVTEAGVMRVNDVCGADAERLGLNVVAKLPAFPPRGTDVNALIDVVGKQVIAAYWNHRYPKYPYEQSPWVWWASVKREEHNANP